MSGERRWFQVEGLRIRTTGQGRTLTAYRMSLLDALEAKRELDASIDELCLALDVKNPPPRTRGDD